MPLTQERWGTYEGREIYQFVLTNAQTKVVVTNLGCTIIEIAHTDRPGNLILAYDKLEEYVNDPYYLNSIIGRVANRVGDGLLPVGNEQYQLTLNEPERNNHLHGGFAGFNRKIFEIANLTSTAENVAVTLRAVSEHLEEGYPGKLILKVTFSIDRSGQFTIHYQAETDRDTHINLTHHTYFRKRASSVYTNDDRLSIASDYILETNERFLPTGRLLPVADTLKDFRTKRNLYVHDAAASAPVYNDYYFFRTALASNTFPIEVNFSNNTVMKMATSYPGVLLYSGDYLDKPFSSLEGFCLECQLPPNAANHPNLSSTLLNAGRSYDYFITHQFLWHH